ncbi:MAG: GGDEF domain-containing protein [Lachnospiraceae bacterium]|nr:GGDEF domain-containing protein [Lachnospiraceae bacterium]
MGNRFSRQEQIKINKKIATENIRRIFLTSLVCAVLIPVYILINKYSGAEDAKLLNGALIGFEGFYIITAAFSLYMMKNRESSAFKYFPAVFWILFEISTFAPVRENMHNGVGLTLFAAMLAAVMLVPIMPAKEQIYNIVIELVYIIILEAMCGTSGAAIFNLIILNGALFAFSRVAYRIQRENFALKERISDKRDSEGNDALTGLLNHRGLEKRTFDLTKDCIRDRRRLSVLLVDLDDLQCYNDTYGAEKGDSCIKKVADIILQVSLRNTDLIGRMYGGKFLICMEGGDDMEPVRLAEKIRTAVEQKRIPHGRRAEFQFVTVSIGVASCIPKSENDYNEMYDEAENSMFCAKEQGRNVTVYEEQIYGAYKREAL